MNRTSLSDSISAAEGHDNGIQGALARSLLGHNMVAEVGHLTLIGFMVLLLWEDVGRFPLGCWAAAVMGVTSFRLFMRRRLSTRDPDPRDLSRLVRRVVVLTALAWSAGPVAFGAGLPVEHYALLMVVFSGLVAAATSTLVGDRLTFRLFSATLLLPLAAVLILNGQTHFHFIAMGVIVFFGATMWLQHARAHEQLVRRLSSDAELSASERDAVRNKRFLDALLACAPTAVGCLDKHGRVSMVNPAFEALFGYSAEEAIGADVNELLLPPGDVERGRAFDTEARQGHAVVREVVRQRKDGSLVPVKASGAVAGAGAEGALFVLYDDLTDTMRAREKLAERERYYRSLLHSLHEDIMVIDRDFRIVDINNSALRTVGGERGDVIGRPCYEVSHGYSVPCDRRGEECALSELWRTGVSQQCRHVHKRLDGSTFHADILLSPLKDVDGNVTMAIEAVRDITDLMSAKEALRESEEKFRAITSSAQDAILMIDDTGTVVFWNEAAERVIGYPAEEVLGGNLHQMIVPERFHAAHAAAFPAFVKTGRGSAVGQTLELVAVRKDGKEIPVELSLSSVLLGGRWNAVGILRDISERKRAEAERDNHVRQLEAQAVELTEARDAAETAARAKAAFLASMSHEIRTPIHGVLGTLDLMLDDELTGEQRRLVQQAYDSGDALLRIINDILDFTKIESGRLELEEITFDPVGLAEAVVRMLVVRTEEHGIELVCDVRPDVPRAVRGDPGRIRQVLTNIVGNAVKFTTDGEVVLVVESLEQNNGAVDLAFSVRDTGIGIPPEKIEAIFEDFKQVDASTSRRFGGSGLGLAISARLLGLMGSEMRVTSEVGRGSEFRFVVTLPVEETSLPEPIGGLETLLGIRTLVVDDNAVNRRIVTEMLTPTGMVIAEAPDAKTALEMFGCARSEGIPYEVGIIDGHMPGMDGYQLVEKIRGDTALAGLKLMMLTSGGQAGDGQRCRTLNISAYLTKPVSRSDLLEALVRLIGRSAEPRAGQLVTRHSIEESRVRVRVLLAEDNVVNQTIAASVLRKRGHEVHVVENGRQAVEAVVEHEFDVVLMDVQMPEMDGRTATREIRQIRRLEKLPIVALTAHIGEDEREACRSAGMDGYLCKPFKPHELFSVVEGWGGDGGGGGAE